jgi:hypothetical protein
MGGGAVSSIVFLTSVLELGGQLYAPVALTPTKEPLAPIV